MGNAVWLFISVPVWFFMTLARPFSEGMLTFVPAVGIVCLALGAVLAFRRPHRAHLWALASFGASQGYVVTAGFLRGAFPGGGLPLAIGFLCVQLVCLLALLHFPRGARVAAVPLSAFCAIYALFAAFVAEMSLTNTWL